MKPVVCIPWRDSGEPSRGRAFEWCWRWWHYNHLPVVTSAGPPGLFNIAAARNMAAASAVDVYEADVLIFADADTVPQMAPVELAVEIAAAQLGAVYPHDHYWSLPHEFTAWLLESDPIEPEAGRLAWPASALGPANRVSVSGVIVCSTHSFAAADGFDDRFTCWGAEDVAFALVARDVLGSALRLPGNVWHLWHERGGYPTTTDQRHDALFEQYKTAAVEGPHALRVLRGMAEGHPWI